MTVRVLIVDDQPTFRAAAREVIATTDGFVTVGEAASGEESIRLARELRPDLVLMDILLPGIDGIEATRRIRDEQSRVVVFLLSTYDPDDFGLRIEASGAHAFIPKARFGPASVAAHWHQAVDKEG